MIRKIILTSLFVFLSSACVAEDGLTIQFTIQKSNIGQEAHDSYTNAILMSFNEEVS